MKFYKLYLLMLLLPGILPGGVTVHAQTELSLDSSKETGVSLSLNGARYTVTLDESGRGIINIPDSVSPDYASIYGKNRIFSMYIIPGQWQKITESPDRSITFDGAGKEINDYLLEVSNTSRQINYTAAENVFLQDWKNRVNEIESIFENSKLPDYFRKIERKRLHYLAAKLLSTYGNFHGTAMSDEYYSALGRLLIEDAETSHLAEYVQSFREYFLLLNIRDIPEATPLEKVSTLVSRTNTNISNPDLKGFLIHEYLYDHIRRNGVSGIDSLLTVYREVVKNPRQISAFNNLLKKQSGLVKGSKAPDFELQDSEGKTVKLSDLAGEYVYIDVWATWCGPCNREYPHFAALKNKFKDKPIKFIGISTDSNKDAWLEKIKSKQMDGIQLLATGSSFEQDYNITFVPRFILIDPEGCIIDVNMSRPSHPDTMEYFEKL